MISFVGRNQGGDCHIIQSGDIVAMKVHDKEVFTMCMFQRLNSVLNVGLSGQITWEQDIGVT